MASPYLRSLPFCYRHDNMVLHDATSFCRALSHTPQSLYRAKLGEAIEQQRERLAAVQLDLLVLRTALDATESDLEMAARPIFSRLQRLQRHIRQVERHARWLRREDTASPLNVPTKARPRVDTASHAGPTRNSTTSTSPSARVAAPPGLGHPSPLLRSTFIQLARQFHPDLAANPDQHLKRSALMAHINALYSAKDEFGLLALAKQLDHHGVHLGTEHEPPQTDGCATSALEAELERLEAVIEHQQMQHDALQKSERYVLYQALEQHHRAPHQSRHPFDAVMEDIMAETLRLFDDMAASYRHVDQLVEGRRQALVSRGASVLASTQSPKNESNTSGHKLFHLSASVRAQHQVSPHIEQLSAALVTRASEESAVGRLFLLAYVAELAGGFLWGIETFDALGLRLDTASKADSFPRSFAETLLDADDLVTFSPSLDETGLTAMRLSLRSEELREAISLSLLDFSMRRLFYDVLVVLGEHLVCAGCSEAVFAIPLFLLRGLTDVRALVCPRCAHIARQYVLPRGRDIQATLNPIYLDFDVIEAITIELCGLTVTQQFLPEHMGTCTLSLVKERLVQHVFARHGMELDDEQLVLVDSAGAAISLDTPLSDLAGQTLGTVMSTPGQGAHSLERLVQRARNLAEQNRGYSRHI